MPDQDLDAKCLPLKQLDVRCCESIICQGKVGNRIILNDTGRGEGITNMITSRSETGKLATYPGVYVRVNNGG